MRRRKIQSSRPASPVIAAAPTSRTFPPTMSPTCESASPAPTPAAAGGSNYLDSSLGPQGRNQLRLKRVSINGLIAVRQCQKSAVTLLHWDSQVTALVRVQSWPRSPPSIKPRRRSPGLVWQPWQQSVALASKPAAEDAENAAHLVENWSRRRDFCISPSRLDVEPGGMEAWA